jgi:hypothetical protein
MLLSERPNLRALFKLRRGFELTDQRVATHSSSRSDLNMDTKDLLTAIGISATFVVAASNLIYTVFATRKTRFVNIVTASRIKWIESLRDTVSRFSGLAYHWSITTLSTETSQRIIEESDNLRFLIRLHLNPHDEKDTRVASLVEEIPKFTDPAKFVEMKAAIENLVSGIQVRLKEEWERVKREARGKLA